MRARKNPMIPLAAVAAGLLAGAVGTVCLDAVHYLNTAAEAGQIVPRPGNSRRSKTGRAPPTQDRSPSASSRASPSASFPTVRPG